MIKPYCLAVRDVYCICQAIFNNCPDNPDYDCDNGAARQHRVHLVYLLNYTTQYEWWRCSLLLVQDVFCEVLAR